MTDTPIERAADSIWTSLRRRKVVQWGLAYAAGAWVLLQVLGFATDTYGWPTVIAQLAMLGLTLGLPIVVTLAWYHGDRGQQRITGCHEHHHAHLALPHGPLQPQAHEAQTLRSTHAQRPCRGGSR